MRNFMIMKMIFRVASVIIPYVLVIVMVLHPGVVPVEVGIVTAVVWMSVANVVGWGATALVLITVDIAVQLHAVAIVGFLILALAVVRASVYVVSAVNAMGELQTAVEDFQAVITIAMERHALPVGKGTVQHTVISK